MSEYQYYEFEAINRPLSVKEMAELRSYSTRARITPTSFVNDYSWGDFKHGGHPAARPVHQVRRRLGVRRRA